VQDGLAGTEFGDFSRIFDEDADQNILGRHP
jgi:hypothetical protein